MSDFVGSVGWNNSICPATGAGLPSKAPRSGAWPSPLERALPGMVARGHGIETLCLYLRLDQSALFELVVTLGLPTPPNKAHRTATARNCWQAKDISVFIVLWMDGWAAVSLAERFGRSRNAVWSKARQLGLPRRDRSDQFRPADPNMALPQDYVGKQRPAGRSCADVTPRSPVEYADVSPVVHPVLPGLALETLTHPVPTLTIPGVTPVQLAAALDLSPIVRKGGRGEIVYTPARDLQIALRHYGSQHYVAAAREMGMSVFAYLTRRKRLRLLPMPRGEFVDEFNPEWAAQYIMAHRLRRVQCRAYKSRGVEFYFWCGLNEKLIFSDTAKKMAWCRDGLAQLDLGY